MTQTQQPDSTKLDTKTQKITELDHDSETQKLGNDSQQSN